MQQRSANQAKIKQASYSRASSHSLVKVLVQQCRSLAEVPDQSHPDWWSEPQLLSAPFGLLSSTAPSPLSPVAPTNCKKTLLLIRKSGAAGPIPSQLGTAEPGSYMAYRSRSSHVAMIVLRQHLNGGDRNRRKAWQRSTLCYRCRRNMTIVPRPPQSNSKQKRWSWRPCTTYLAWTMISILPTEHFSSRCSADFVSHGMLPYLVKMSCQSSEF